MTLIVKHDRPPPTRTESAGFAMTLAGMAPGDHFDVAFSRRKALSVAISKIKRKYPGWQFQCETSWREGEKITTCWRIAGGEQVRATQIVDQSYLPTIVLQPEQKYFIAYADDDTPNVAEFARKHADSWIVTPDRMYMPGEHKITRGLMVIPRSRVKKD